MFSELKENTSETQGNISGRGPRYRPETSRFLPILFLKLDEEQELFQEMKREPGWTSVLQDGISPVTLVTLLCRPSREGGVLVQKFLIVAG
jgi:hypothetical protein